MANVYDDILDSVVKGIRDLSIVDDSLVVKCKVPRKLKNDPIVAKMPCVLVAPFGAVSRSSRSNLKDLVVYPVLVAVVRSSSNSQTENITEHLTALQEIQRAFRPRGTLTLSEALTVHVVTDVAPRSSYDLPAWFEQYDIGDVLLRFHMGEPRSQAV